MMVWRVGSQALPTVLIIAGPNGAGKTSFAKSWLPGRGGDFEFVNADEIARQSSLPVGPARDVAAGREMIKRLDEISRRGGNMLVETTLSTRIYVRWIEVWRSRGYAVELIYIRLPDVETSLARVARRVALGGHAIPEADIRRRFARGLANLETLYKPLVDVWEIWDSREGEQTLADRSFR